MRAVDIITKKREGGNLSLEELDFLISGYCKGDIPDYQISAWAMAVFFKGMSPEETAFLTQVMLSSGKTIDLSGIQGPFVDKHSTGGVGDKTSLILAPLAASLGICDPMMSGRALGHTGGTLDKLEYIPGYRTSLSEDEFRNIIKKCGFAMTGQTQDIVPADRLLYALRDVSGTVESIPLITASILSKKKAEGTENLVLDVKFGSGAFMKEISAAEKLAASLVKTGNFLGLKTKALLTDMNQPLGNKTGNFLEIEESLDCLEGNWPDDLKEVTMELAQLMVILGGKADNYEDARLLCEKSLSGGKPRELFLKNIENQGGNAEQVLKMRGNFRSSASKEIKAKRSACISRIDAWKTGLAAVHLGVGRNKKEDRVDPGAGIEFFLRSGDFVNPGDLIMKIWAKDEASLNTAIPLLEEAVEYDDDSFSQKRMPPASKLVIKEIG